MNRRRIALILLIVGVLCLPAPQYLGWAAQALSPTAQTSQIYAAEKIDLGNPADQKRFVDRYGQDVTLADYQLTMRYESDYRSPNETRRALERAMENGSATVSNASAQIDLREIDAEYEFVRDSEAGTDGYYRLDIREDGFKISLSPVSLGVIANATAKQAPRYANLTDGEQQTVDAILTESSENVGGFRPQVTDPYVDKLPTSIWKGDQLYSIYRSGHVDDFGPGFAGFVVGLGVAVIGIILVVAGTILYIYDRWKISQ